MDFTSQDWCHFVSIIILGASGDLAQTKIFPCLFDLYIRKLLPNNYAIFGYGRKSISNIQLRSKIREQCERSNPSQIQLEDFLMRVFYISGDYSSTDDMRLLNHQIQLREEMINDTISNRLFYFAIPPAIFSDTALAVKQTSMSHSGWTRIVIEKPFGHDLQSAKLLSQNLANSFTEKQIYRIDHYLGKEMVQNILYLRFGNSFFEPFWNRDYIQAVVITLKEDFGVAGRAGYFDQNGIIRDVIQNHLIQVMCLIAMELPESWGDFETNDEIRNEKVAMLNSIQPISIQDIILGQYDGYKTEEGVPKNSKCPTFAAIKMFINNRRWQGVPFILKAGKFLNERKVEVRVQFKPSLAGSNLLFNEKNIGHKNLNSSKRISPNELVLRLQPNEAIYFKINIKNPGFRNDVLKTVIDLTYRDRFQKSLDIPNAYTRLIYDVLNGKQDVFVRDDELEASWRIFTPLLEEIERSCIKPILYSRQSRGPTEADQLIFRTETQPYVPIRSFL